MACLGRSGLDAKVVELGGEVRDDRHGVVLGRADELERLLALLHLTPRIEAHVLGHLLALVILGGTKRIVNVVQAIVPFMAIAYLFLALYVVATHWSEVPAMLAQIIESAFGLAPAAGGVIGGGVVGVPGLIPLPS